MNRRKGHYYVSRTRRRHMGSGHQASDQTRCSITVWINRSFARTPVISKSSSPGPGEENPHPRPGNNTHQSPFRLHCRPENGAQSAPGPSPMCSTVQYTLPDNLRPVCSFESGSEKLQTTNKIRHFMHVCWLLQKWINRLLTYFVRQPTSVAAAPAQPKCPCYGSDMKPLR